jgi:gluconokinase
VDSNFGDKAMFIILTGVAGAGKTTIGKLLAGELGWQFHEGDDFHPLENIEKMRRGEALSDRDRAPWLDRLHALIEQALERQENGILACSALKRSYRTRLRVDDRVVFVHLAVSRALTERRLKERKYHFMNPALVKSQFDTLEPPQTALTLDASLPPAVLVEQVRKALGI